MRWPSDSAHQDGCGHDGLGLAIALGRAGQLSAPASDRLMRVDAIDSPSAKRRFIVSEATGI
jgi:hypothetical protein